ncbi:MAG: hypothetical protein K0R51_225 [Cytophagaceae bacterium]|jgi:hypothetical protein|nr:hypothetical protein [Cytophagaceae bacterium]
MFLGVPLRVGLSATSPRSVIAQFITYLSCSLRAFRFYPSRELNTLLLEVRNEYSLESSGVLLFLGNMTQK